MDSNARDKISKYLEKVCCDTILISKYTDILYYLSVCFVIIFLFVLSKYTIFKSFLVTTHGHSFVFFLFFYTNLSFSYCGDYLISFFSMNTISILFMVFSVRLALIRFILSVHSFAFCVFGFCAQRWTGLNAVGLSVALCERTSYSERMRVTVCVCGYCWLLPSRWPDAMPIDWFSISACIRNAVSITTPAGEEQG